ncbi:NAD(P)H-quinone oxidoreductase [Pseudemcibacter aquimaris]|uniref:NAD(P)H-quinone oxidoreductase n=1 Tax=Pseudemcibacter aquimaris TaxID=2857064 RepID=UPI0020134D9E|nr:NAD(P)H-quinone oxidoreductase [Pseudemcibacter aquimaris]MCC3860048.1 NAD(P)H-quinone oxidoreductase [Pseudemcibacter aquimaris]WDU57378.1 NAD(P)H-quinone oxidoreductase [Pseudemcibacter aquimaris]
MNMKAVITNGDGGPEVLEMGNTQKPAPAAVEVLIKVEYAGINRPDIVQRNGLYPPPPGASPILGLECSGEIVEIGENVTEWNIGDKVCALLSGGGYAEYTIAHMDSCLPVPAGLDMAHAAAIPETYFTAWSNIFDRASLKPNETILIHGGTSGIGTTAIQMAKAHGATVITTSGSNEKCEFCKKLGAEFTINYKTENFREMIMEYTNGRGVDVLLDMVAGQYMTDNVKSMAPDGRLVIIAVQGGPKVDFNILPVMLKRLTITGSTLRPRDNAFKGDIARNLREHIWPFIEKGDIGPIVNKTFPLDQAADAHRHLESGDVIGKVILKI